MSVFRALFQLKFDTCSFTHQSTSAWNLPASKLGDLSGVLGPETDGNERKWEEALAISILTLFIWCSNCLFHLLIEATIDLYYLVLSGSTYECACHSKRLSKRTLVDVDACRYIIQVPQNFCRYPPSQTMQLEQ